MRRFSPGLVPPWWSGPPGLQCRQSGIAPGTGKIAGVVRKTARSKLWLLFFCLLLTAALHAAVDGTIFNGTTGKAESGVAVTMVRPGGVGGMEVVASTKSGAQGQFHFDQSPSGPTLLQAAHQGVTYNLMLPPGAPSSELRLQVYDVTAKPDAAKVSQDLVLLEPANSQLSVRENIIFNNSGKLTYDDRDNGTLRIYVPAAAKDSLQVSAAGPNGMPLPQTPVETGQPGVYKINFAVKPGETTFDIGYTMPFSSPGIFFGRTLHKGAPVRLAVPAGVSLKGEGLEFVGQEPKTQATIYGVKTPDYKVEIEGTGVMASASSESADNGPGLDQILPKIYSSLYPIVGLALAILALGFILLYRRSAEPVRTESLKANPGGKRRR